MAIGTATIHSATASKKERGSVQRRLAHCETLASAPNTPATTTNPTAKASRIAEAEIGTYTLEHLQGQSAIRTVDVATTFPTGASFGSLHVSTSSPARAAGLWLMSTVPLPATTVPLFVGGF